jgi:hypothetical protein
MDKHCWYKLNIETEGCLLPEFKFPEPTGDYGVWHPLAKDVFKPWWLAYMRKMGLPIYTVMLFYRGPGAGTFHAHIDIAKTDPFELTPFGINWVYGGKGSNMVWYDLPGDYEKNVHYTAAKTPYVYWNVSELNEIDRTELTEGTVTLVQTSLPHSIEMKDQPRWCFSARSSIPDSQSFENAVKMFKKKNLLVER